MLESRLPWERFSVLGMGKSGVAAANLLAQRGYDVLIAEHRSVKEVAQELRQLDQRVRAICGTNDTRPGDIVVISPGISPHSDAFLAAERSSRELWSEIELFYRLCPAPIVAVTGTDGKSTTTALIGHLFNAQLPHVFVGGNIGNALCEGLDELTPESWVVAEVSCFQLTTIRQFRPRVAVFTNIAEDHTTYHGSHQAYIEAKQRLYENMGQGDSVVINARDAITAAWTTPAAVRRVDYHSEQRVAGGIYLEGSSIVSEIGGEARVLADRRDLPLPGRHNLENALAALAAAELCGLKRDVLRGCLRQFVGLPHRLQAVATIDGVHYLNDSKATNPHAAIAALKTFATPVLLLAGGADKRSDYRELADHVRRHVKLAILFGETRQQLRDAFEGVSTILARDLADAVRIAHRQARKGDTVLLSPACASFDMFRSFEHRGDRFVELVKALQGEV